MSIQALRERLAASNKAANKLLADKGSATWTKEDQATFDNHADESERIQRQIEAHEKMIAKDRENSFDDADQFKSSLGGDKKMTDEQKAVNIFLRKSVRDMSAEEAQFIRNTMSTSTSSEGGYTVQPKVAASLIDLLKSYGFMRKVASQITTENGVDLNYPTSDGTSEIGELVAQNASANSADASFGTRALNAYKFGSKIVTVPIELLQDSSIDIQAFVFSRLRDRIGRAQNLYFTTGTGAAQPFGLAVAASVGKTGNTGQTATVLYDDLVDLVDSLDAAYLDVLQSTPQLPTCEPGFMFSQNMRRVVRKMKDGAGRPIWTPSYDEGMASATPDRLLGYPVYINNDMPTPAANAKSIAFGNMHMYTIRDAMALQLFRFDDSAYMSKGQVGFLAWARAGGNLMDINSVKLYQHSAT